jgi:hypothetical protein
VNGLHTTLAFVSLSRALPRGRLALSKDKLTPPWDALPLADPAEAQATLWAWATARLLVLVFE